MDSITHEDPIRSNGMERHGHVYLVKSEQYYKVGRTKHLPSRITTIRVNNPHEVVMIHSVKVTNANVLEEVLLSELAEYRHRGEWFSLTHELVDDVINLMNAYV